MGHREIVEFASKYVANILEDFTKQFPKAQLGDFSLAVGLAAQDLIAAGSATVVSFASKEMAQKWLDAVLGDLDKKINSCIRDTGLKCSVKSEIAFTGTAKKPADPGKKDPPNFWGERFSFGEED